VVQHRPAAVQIEIAVVGEIHGCVGIGVRVIDNHQAIILRKRVADLHAKIPGIALFAIGRKTAAHDAAPLNTHIPDSLVKALQAAVEMVLA
jgi:hypothetical protein